MNLTPREKGCFITGIDVQGRIYTYQDPNKITDTAGIANTKPIAIVDGISIVVKEVDGDIGSIVTVPVLLVYNETDVGAFIVGVQFNSDYVELVDVVAGTWTGELLVDDSQISQGILKIQSQLDHNISTECTLFNLRLLVKATVPVETTAIPISNITSGVYKSQLLKLIGGVYNYISPVNRMQGKIILKPDEQATDTDTLPVPGPSNTYTNSESSVDFNMKGYSGEAGSGSVNVYADGVLVGTYNFNLVPGWNTISGSIPLNISSGYHDITYEIKTDKGNYVFIPAMGFNAILTTNTDREDAPTIPRRPIMLEYTQRNFIGDFYTVEIATSVDADSMMDRLMIDTTNTVDMKAGLFVDGTGQTSLLITSDSCFIEIE